MWIDWYMKSFTIRLSFTTSVRYNTCINAFLPRKKSSSMLSRLSFRWLCADLHQPDRHRLTMAPGFQTGQKKFSVICIAVVGQAITEPSDLV